MEKSRKNDANKRMPVISTGFTPLGSHVAEITYESAGGYEKTVKVPLKSVELALLPNERQLCIVSEYEVGGGVFRPSFVFQGVNEPQQPSDALEIDLVDMVESGAAMENIKAFIADSQKVDLAAIAAEAAVEDNLEITLEPANMIVLDDSEPVAEWNEDPAWGGSLLAGGREKKTAPWDFSPTFLPNHVVMDGKAVRVNKKDGSANSWSVFNPLLADSKREAGALLGSVSDRYYTLGHPVWVKPLLKYAEMSGIKAAVTAWNEGAKCRVDLDVTDATQLRGKAADRIKEKGGSQFLDLDSMSEAAQRLDGLYKFGFAVNNSLDGRGSFNSYGAALRTYCQNLAVAGGIKCAINMRHTKGVMQDVDWDEFGLNLVNATAELNEWLVNTELMSWIPMDLQLMDQLLFVMEQNGVMTIPRVIKNKDSGEVTQVNRSHMDLAVTDGWKNPTLSYVSVKGEQKNTLYHALQCFTGAITHKPTVVDDKRELKGSVLGFDSLDTRLRKVNQVFTGIAAHALNEARNVLEVEKLTLEHEDEVKNILEIYPNMMGDIYEAPKYTETHEIAVL